jgi:hypothetical protein
MLISMQADWENKMSGIRANKSRDEQTLQELRDRSAELQRQREVLIKKLGQIEATEQVHLPTQCLPCLTVYSPPLYSDDFQQAQ